MRLAAALQGRAPVGAFDPRAAFDELAAKSAPFQGMTLAKLGSRGLGEPAPGEAATAAQPAPAGA